MFNLPGVLGTLANLAVVVVGFGAIVFILELGHFLPTKWAGIRILAFSMGMGPVVCSDRKGMGFRKGSTEAKYRDPVNAEAKDAKPAEFRFSALLLADLYERWERQQPGLGHGARSLKWRLHAEAD